jgi:hypothetical protein
MPFENPTGGDAGASIQERLESYLAAEDSPEPEQKAKGNAGADGELDFEAANGNDNPNPDANADQDDKPAGDDSEDDQGPQISTADLAKFLGVDESLVDVDDEGNPVLKTKIDGKDGAAKFTDVLKSYQLQGHVDNKAREVAEQQRALQQRMAEADQAANERIQKLESAVGLAQQELMREFQSVDWQTLRAQNPGEYSALFADFQARQARLDSFTQQAETERTTQQGKQREQLQAFVMEERQKLPTVIPEWKDAAVADRESKEIKEWATKNGFEANELNGIVRSPHVAALRKAMLYDRLKQAKSATEKLVRTAPKLVKAGQAQTQTREQQTVRNLKENVRKSGGKTDAVAAFLIASGKA